MTNSKLNKQTLDLIEQRLIDGMLGKVELSASVMEILRRVCVDNGRLVVGVDEGDSSYLEDAETDELGADILKFEKK